MNTQKSSISYKEALQYFPGGVNSPVRAFKSVDGDPVFIERGDGCKIYDIDGNEYIDFCCSWGPLILGHNHPAVKKSIIEAVEKGCSFGAPTLLENELAELILSNNKYIEKIRFVSSGTEAVMSAIRLARGYTKRDKIIKFDGCYHGHSDGLLVNAGSGLATFGTSSSAGVPESYAQQTIVLPLNDKKAVKKAFENYPNQIACIVIEPIPANNGLLLQDKEYLQFLREICTEHGTILLFDEVISGFRVGFEGAAGYYDIQPDIITYGKIIGGGMPVGAYGASTKIMSEVAPDGAVYQAGTLSGNPVAMAAGIAQLKECLQPQFYENLTAKTQEWVKDLNIYFEEKNHPVQLFTIGSIYWLAFSKQDKIQAASDIDGESMRYFKKLYSYLLDNGVYMGPSGYEVGFVSHVISKDDLKKAAAVIKAGIDSVFS